MIYNSWLNKIEINISNKSWFSIYGYSNEYMRLYLDYDKSNMCLPLAIYSEMDDFELRNKSNENFYIYQNETEFLIRLRKALQKYTKNNIIINNVIEEFMVRVYEIRNIVKYTNTFEWEA